MKTYRRHNCTRNHRTWRALAQCIWPRTEWINGNGKYATVAYCHVLTIMLHQTLDDAAAALHAINDTGCGGRCNNRHEIIELENPTTK